MQRESEVRAFMDWLIDEVLEATPVPLSAIEVRRLRTILSNAEFMLRMCQQQLAGRGDDAPEWMQTDAANAQMDVAKAKRELEHALSYGS